MPSQAPWFDIARYLISYSYPDSTIHIAAAALSSAEARISHIPNMYPITRGAEGLRNGFNRYRVVNYEQFFHIDGDRYLGYPNALVNNDGRRTPPSLSYTLGISQATVAPGQDFSFNMPVASDGGRRHSSSISPRTTQAETYERPFSNFSQLPVCQELTPPSFNNVPNRTTQAQVATKPSPRSFHHPSLSTISSTIRTSTTTTCIETPTETPGSNQSAILVLLSDICTETLRRKWHNETLRRSLRSLASQHHPSSGRHHRHSRSRYSPYAPLSAVPHGTSSRSHRPPQQPRPGRDVTASISHPPLSFMELMQRVASMIWENATEVQQAEEAPSAAAPHSAGSQPSAMPATATRSSGEAETAAIDAMRTLYSLGNSIVAASRGGGGERFSVDEMRDIVVAAVGFCRVLGCAEGADRCEEVGRWVFGRGGGDHEGYGEERGRGRWWEEGSVL